MKNLSAVVAVAISSCMFSIAFAQPSTLEISSSNLVPPPFTSVNPDGENQPDWQVKVVASHVDSAGQVVKESPTVFVVRNGFCTSAKERLVNIQPSGQAKVTQKMCVGSVGEGKSTLVGWVFSDNDQHSTLSEDGDASLHYGTRVVLTFEGNSVEGVFGEYRISAKKIDS
ncbi:TPA: hypothetical protein ACWLUJ_006140 [Pseudomonas aeruginosa]|nr:hypothetical protein [Pseudomonas aeruginosa]